MAYLPLRWGVQYMIRFSKLSGLTAVAISVIIVVGAYIYVEYQKNKIQRESIFPVKKDESQLVSPEMERGIAGTPFTAGKEDFEKIVLGLLLVSPDDKKGSIAGRHEIDVRKQEQYFLPAALLEYKKFCFSTKSSNPHTWYRYRCSLYMRSRI